jgi:hypothetical protein
VSNQRPHSVPNNAKSGDVCEAEYERYETWQQLGGYFDGDGNVGVEVVKYVLRFKLRFSDTWRPQIAAIKSFLNSHEITTANISRVVSEGRRDAFKIDIGAIDSALRAANAMLPYCAKKAEDLKIMIDYVEGRITGNQAIARLNEEVRIGRRSGFTRELNLPYNRSEGLRLAQLENAKSARLANAVNVGIEIQERIRNDHLISKLGHIKLSKKYGYSTSVIRRILGAP